MGNLLWNLKWRLLAKPCPGCTDPDHHTHRLTWLGRLYYAPWIWIDNA